MEQYYKILKPQDIQDQFNNEIETDMFLELCDGVVSLGVFIENEFITLEMLIFIENFGNKYIEMCLKNKSIKLKED